MAQPNPIDEPAARLSRERVLRAALGLADAEGIESLTIRRLAQELGVGAMSVYYYVASKDEILSGITDLVVNEMEFPKGSDWKAALRSASISAHDVLLQHPWAASQLLSGASISRPRFGHMNAILGCLRGAGFSAEMTDHAYHALDSHIMGFTLWQVGISVGLAGLGSVSDFLATLDRDALPHLAEHVDQHLKDRGPDEVPEFEFGLDLILDGLERLLASAERGTSPE
jgi:AcrR family transcriptional regulator